MKIHIWTVLVVLIARAGLTAVETNLTIKVVDDDGTALGDVQSVVIIDSKDGRRTTNMVTDTNGCFAINVRIPARISFDGQKNGYYRSIDNFYLVPNNNYAELEPWGGRTLTLRKIKDPQKGMQVARGKGKPRDFPVYDHEIGFDLLAGDWVAPYGKGQVTDFTFLVSVDKESKITYYAVEFQNEGDGIQEYSFMPPFNSSRFKWPHKAPLDGYKTCLKKKYIWGGDQTRLPDFEEYPEYDTIRTKPLNYIFRTRTQYDEDGNITSAYYGRINGDIIDLRYHKREMLNYWINTDPTSRSLESIDLADQN